MSCSSVDQEGCLGERSLGVEDVAVTLLNWHQTEWTAMLKDASLLLLASLNS